MFVDEEAEWLTIPKILFKTLTIDQPIALGATMEIATSIFSNIYNSLGICALQK